jgi:hypothetical protein
VNKGGVFARLVRYQARPCALIDCAPDNLAHSSKTTTSSIAHSTIAAARATRHRRVACARRQQHRRHASSLARPRCHRPRRQTQRAAKASDDRACAQPVACAGRCCTRLRTMTTGRSTRTTSDARATIKQMHLIALDCSTVHRGRHTRAKFYTQVRMSCFVYVAKFEFLLW